MADNSRKIIIGGNSTVSKFNRKGIAENTLYFFLIAAPIENRNQGNKNQNYRLWGSFSYRQKDIDPLSSPADHQVFDLFKIYCNLLIIDIEFGKELIDKNANILSINI